MPNSTTVIPENQIVVEADSEVQTIEIKLEDDAAQYYAEQAMAAAQDASASATSAGASATSAGASAVTATDAKDTAVTAKNTAVSSSESASASATAATNAKDTAVTAKDNAYYYYQQTEILYEKAVVISEGMTLAEYEALPESKKMDGTVWFVTDVCSLDDGDLEDF